MNSLISKSLQSNLFISYNALSSMSIGGLYRSYTGRVIESVEIPREIVEKYHKPHRDQPTRERKRRVKVEHQTKRNLILKKHQKPITDWRLAPVNHLPKFDESTVKPKTNYRQQMDTMEDEAFGWQKRKEEKANKIKEQEDQVMAKLKEMREAKRIEDERILKSKRDALKARQTETTLLIN